MSDVSRHGFRHAGSVCRGCQSSLPKSLRIRSREITVLARAGPTVLARTCAGVNRLKAGAKAWVPTSNALAANMLSLSVSKRDISSAATTTRKLYLRRRENAATNAAAAHKQPEEDRRMQLEIPPRLVWSQNPRAVHTRCSASLCSPSFLAAAWRTSARQRTRVYGAQAQLATRACCHA